MGEALELVVAGVGSFLDRGEADRDIVDLLQILRERPPTPDEEHPGAALAAYASELHGVWDAWTRFRPFGASETYRAVDTAALLLESIGATEESAHARDLMTVPLAVLAARLLADHVLAEASGSALAPAVPTEPEDQAESPANTEKESSTEEHSAEQADMTRPVRLRAVNGVRRMQRIEDERAPASIRALRAIDPALPLVTWSELSDTITAVLSTGRLDPQVLADFTRRSIDERARAAVESAAGRGTTIRPEHVVWVISVLRARCTGSARVTRATATALVAEYIAELAPRAGVDPRRVRQDMMAWVDVERA